MTASLPTLTGTATGWSITTHLAALALGALLMWLYVQLTKPRGGDRKDAPALGPQEGKGWPYGMEVVTTPHMPPGTILVADTGTISRLLDDARTPPYGYAMPDPLPLRVQHTHMHDDVLRLTVLRPPTPPTEPPA